MIGQGDPTLLEIVCDYDPTTRCVPVAQSKVACPLEILLWLGLAYIRLLIRAVQEGNSVQKIWRKDSADLHQYFSLTL